MKAAIIDNEAQIREGLLEMLTMLPNDIDTVVTATGIQEGLVLLQQEQPDLVFLDVEMDDGTGFDLLRQLPKINFELIFITAHNKYAIDAFKFSAIHFLLKPIDFDELQEAVERAKQSMNKSRISEQLNVLHERLSKGNGERKIVLKDAKSLYFLRVAEILRCEASGSYTCFYLSDGQQIVVSKTLKEYEALLADDGFVRTHHSHLVNINNVKRLDKADGGTLILENGDAIPVSQRKWEYLMTILSERF